MTDETTKPDVSKQQRLMTQKFLEKSTVFLHLDPRHPGVEVPMHFQHQSHLLLQIGHHLPIPIPDLEISETGVQATLTFQQVPHRCEIPWEAVFAIHDEHGNQLAWPQNMPPEFQIHHRVVITGPPAAAPPGPSLRDRFKAIEGGKAEMPGISTPGTPANHLSIVKEEED
jgi:hypothetical protein